MSLLIGILSQQCPLMPFRPLVTPQQSAVLRFQGVQTAGGFGSSVATTGTMTFVGAPAYSDDSGRVVVAVSRKGHWQQSQVLKAHDTYPDDGFGTSVAVDGRLAVIGAPGHARGTGRAYVFAEENTRWVQVAELRASDATVDELFGYAVAISGSTVLVGAPDHALERNGTAYVFQEDEGSWRQACELQGTGIVQRDAFGISVALSDSLALVGADFQYQTGRVYVYRWSRVYWHLIGVLRGPNPQKLAFFGESVAASSGAIVVGAFGYDSGRGQVSVFRDGSAGWRSVAEVEGPPTRENFGLAVAATRGMIAVGATDVDRPSNVGEAFLFDYLGEKLHEAAVLVPSGSQHGRFGAALAMDGSLLIVGAPLTGCAYVFGS